MSGTNHWRPSVNNAAKRVPPICDTWLWPTCPHLNCSGQDPSSYNTEHRGSEKETFPNRVTGLHPAVSLMCQKRSVWEKTQKHTVGFPWRTDWGTDGEQKICWKGRVNTPVHNKYARLVHQWICQHRSLSINSQFRVLCLKIKLSIGSLQIPSSGEPF